MTGSWLTPEEFQKFCGLPQREAHDRHVEVLRAAISRSKAVNAKAVVAYGIPLPACYRLAVGMYEVDAPK